MPLAIPSCAQRSSSRVRTPVRSRPMILPPQGVHRNVARSRLERLVAAGLLASTFERRSGRNGPGAGRPAKTYAVRPGLEAIEFPSRRYETLLGLLLDALPAAARTERLRGVGAAFGDELAARPACAPHGS